jgi:hypothetical protein
MVHMCHQIHNGARSLLQDAGPTALTIDQRSEQRAQAYPGAGSLYWDPLAQPVLNPIQHSYTWIGLGTQEEIGQPRWASWRRKLQLTKTLPEQFGQALESLKDFANPVISGSTADQATWDPGRRTWNRAD